MNRFTCATIPNHIHCSSVLVHATPSTYITLCDLIIHHMDHRSLATTRTKQVQLTDGLKSSLGHANGR